MCSQDPSGFFDFCSMYIFFAGIFPEDLSWVAYVIAGFTIAFMAINTIVLCTALYTWFERRALARFQSRLGPNRWGPYGLFQPIADLIKLITKEDTVPEEADRPVFNIAPIVLLVPTLLVVSVIPFGQNSFLGSLNVGVLFIISITSVTTIAIFMGGWASRNKYAMLGSMRGVAMLISYEVPMALAIVGVVLMAGSLSLVDIVESQNIPFMLVQPLGFFVFIAAAMAEMSRTPFDQIEAESELGSGYHTEYSGMKFAIFQLAEFMAPLVTGLIIATLYLGGTRGIDPIPGQIWFGLKTFAVVFVMLWFRATWPRLRVDQVMGFAWKVMFSLVLLNLILITVEIQLLQDLESGSLSSNTMWVMAAINWSVGLVCLSVISSIMNRRRTRRPKPTPSPLANMRLEAD